MAEAMSPGGTQPDGKQETIEMMNKCTALVSDEQCLFIPNEGIEQATI